MSVFSRFFGKSDADDSGYGQLVANPKIEHPLSLQVLFQNRARWIRVARPKPSGRIIVRCRERAARLTRHSTKRAKCLGWSGGVSMWSAVLDLTFQCQRRLSRPALPLHYPQELKQRARAHKAHVILYYAG